MERKIQLNDFDHIVVDDIYNGGIYFRMYSENFDKKRVFNDGATQKMGISDSRLDSFINDLIELRDMRDLHRKRLKNE